MKSVMVDAPFPGGPGGRSLSLSFYMIFSIWSTDLRAFCRVNFTGRGAVAEQAGPHGKRMPHLVEFYESKGMKVVEIRGKNFFKSVQWDRCFGIMEAEHRNRREKQ